jgi:ATP-dependent DNA ligase
MSLNATKAIQINSFKYFYPERPRLLHVDQPLFESLSQNRQWVAEPKFNGSRLQLHVIDGAFHFWNRHGEPLVYTPSREVLDSLRSLDIKGYWLFDGEMRHNKTKGIKHQIVFYDVFIADGELLNAKPFWWRRQILTGIRGIFSDDKATVSCAFQYRNRFRRAFDLLIKEDEIEGLVIKDLQGRLNLGRTRPVDSTWMWKVRKPSNRYQF